MTHGKLILALGVIACASAPAAAQEIVEATASSGTPDTRYCMRIEAPTGTRIEEVKCWTRQEWADHDVDVDVAWAREGVRTIG